MTLLIQSKDNPKLKQLRGLIEQSSLRKKQQQTVLEGAHLIESYLIHHQPVCMFTTEEGFDDLENQHSIEMSTCPLFLLPDNIYKSLSTLGQSTPLMAIIDIPQISQTFDTSIDTLIIDCVQDPGNVGTLLRSAAAVGVKQIITTKGTASLWSPRVLRAAMGAHFSLNMIESKDVNSLVNQFNIPVYATSSHRPQSIYQLNLTQPSVWILGNEGQGVNELLLDHAQAVTIPQPGGQESLNVAVAGSICLFEMMRQRISL